MIVLQGRKRPILSLAFVPGTRLLAADGPDHGVELWDLDARATTAVGWLKEHHGSTHLTPAPDGRRLYALGVTSGGGYTFDLATRTPGQLAVPGDPYLTDLTVAPDGSRLLVATFSRSADARVRCLRVGGGGELAAVWDGPPGRAWSGLTVFPDGRRYAALEYVERRPGDQTDLVVGDAATGEVSVRVPAGGMNYTEPLLVHPDGTRLVGVVRTRLVVWDAATGGRVAEVPNPGGGKRHFTGAAFHPAGRWLATSGNDATVKVWDAQAWRPARTFTWSVGQVKSVAYSPDGLLAAAGGDRGQIVVWDVDD